MPDLSLAAVHAFWDSYDRRVLYRVIVALESVESWAADQDPAIDQAIIRLGQAMDLVQTIDFNGLEEPIIDVLAYLRTSRAIRLLQTIDTLSPGTAGRLLTLAEEKTDPKINKTISQSAKLFLHRNLVFERMQLLSRIFSIQRITLILNALEEI